jgi:hypothetical protein
MLVGWRGASRFPSSFWGCPVSVASVSVPVASAVVVPPAPAAALPVPVVFCGVPGLGAPAVWSAVRAACSAVIARSGPRAVRVVRLPSVAPGPASAALVPVAVASVPALPALRPGAAPGWCVVVFPSVGCPVAAAAARAAWAAGWRVVAFVAVQEPVRRSPAAQPRPGVSVHPGRPAVLLGGGRGWVRSAFGGVSSGAGVAVWRWSRAPVSCGGA